MIFRDKFCGIKGNIAEDSIQTMCVADFDGSAQTLTLPSLLH